MQGSLMEEDKKNKKKKTEDELRATWAGRTDIVADVKDGHGYLHSGTIETIVHWLLDHVEYPPPQENKSNGSFNRRTPRPCIRVRNLTLVHNYSNLCHRKM